VFFKKGKIMSAPKHPKGIFCLEGDWWGIKDQTTVEPALELLSKYYANTPPVPSPFYIHKDIGTIEEFEYYLKKWCLNKHSKYSILYLGFHGDPSVLYVGEKKKLTLDELELLLEGKCKNRFIHFGSCSTLLENGNKLNRFIRNTGVEGVCGYCRDVDWVTSAAFEILLLSELQDCSFHLKSLKKFKERFIKDHSQLVKELEFRMVLRRS